MTDDYGFHVSQCSIVRRFFYDTFSQCVNGSVFDGLKMDFVSYTLNLAQSTNDDEQLTGVLVLSSLLQNNRFASKTLRAISAKPGVVKILIEMLTWKSPQEENIRAAAAKIVSNLVQKDPNGIWMRAVTKSMDSVASLLYDSNQIEIHSRSYRIQIDNYDYSFFSSLGLKILHILAKDHVSCTKIGRNTGLLRKVIAITELNLDPMDWQVSPDLKIPAIETLTSLAHKQEKVVDSIGATVLHNLFSLFVMARKNDDDDKAKKLFNAAGKALGVLSVESKHNCDIMRRIKPGSYSNMIVSLISMLEDPATFLHVARILRNLLAHADAQSLDWKEITRPAPMVVKFVLDGRGARQEAAIGLAAQVFRFMTESRLGDLFEAPGPEIKRSLTGKVLSVLQEHKRPSKKAPRIRIFSVDLLISLMTMDKSKIEMRSEVQKALEEIITQGFGTIALSSNLMDSQSSIVLAAMDLLRN